MGAFSEYLDMAAKGMKNISAVAEGNFNRLKDSVGLLPLDQQQEADRRYAICSTCPFASDNASEIHEFYDTKRYDRHCSLCSCPLESKVLSFTSDCGLSVLINLRDQDGNEIVPGYKLKWEKYIK